MYKYIAPVLGAIAMVAWLIVKAFLWAGPDLLLLAADWENESTKWKKALGEMSAPVIEWALAIDFWFQSNAIWFVLVIILLWFLQVWSWPRIARQIERSRVRDPQNPYLVIKPAKIDLWLKWEHGEALPKEHERKISSPIKVLIENIGNSPASDIKLTFKIDAAQLGVKSGDNILSMKSNGENSWANISVSYSATISLQYLNGRSTSEPINLPHRIQNGLFLCLLNKSLSKDTLTSLEPEEIFNHYNDMKNSMDYEKQNEFLKKQMASNLIAVPDIEINLRYVDENRSIYNSYEKIQSVFQIIHSAFRVNDNNVLILHGGMGSLSFRDPDDNDNGWYNHYVNYLSAENLKPSHGAR